jgi:Yip1 domain
LIRRVAGVVLRPRSTLAELVHRSVWVDTWLFILIVVGVCAGVFLRTDIGRQAVIDERVRVIETFGGAVTDADYATLQARPPWWVYFISGGRLLLTPAVTLLVATACWAVARAEGIEARFTQALAVVVHASVVLVIGQLIATPLHYVRESLTSPLNFATVLPGMDEGTLPARFFGSMDLFAVWWLALIVIGLAVLTRRGTRRYAVSAAAVYLVFAAVMAGVSAALGGS